MPEFELLEFVSLVLICIPFSFAYYILKRRKDMIPLLPYLLHNLSPTAIGNSCSILKEIIAPFIVLPLSYHLSFGFLYFLLVLCDNSCAVPSNSMFEKISTSTILPTGLSATMAPSYTSRCSSSLSPRSNSSVISQEFF